MRVARAVVVATALILAASALGAAKDDPKVDAPPQGLVPASVRLADVLALHDKMLGRPGARPARDTVIEDWAFVDSGLAGREHLERSGVDYHSRIVTGAYTEEFGQVGDQRWHRDANGFTSPTTDLDDRSFIAVRVLEDAADPKNDVLVLGKTTDAKPAYVLQVKRPGYHHPEWIYYDAATGNVVRLEYFEGKRRVVSTYDDFRTVDGTTQAWHVHDAWWDRTLDDDWHITAFHAGMLIAPSAFAAPKEDASQGGAQVRGALPAQFVDGFIIVRVKVGDRGLDFELDSSQAESMIDRGVAEDLHLPTYGQATRTSTGASIAYRTVIPDADVGPIHLHNFEVRASDIAYKPSTTTKVVGILGYDFLADNVVHVDYVHSLIEVIPSKYFAGATPIQKAIELPFQIDDGVPLVPMQIGNTLSDRVIVNCDLPLTLVFGTFVAAHADELQDMNPGKHQKRFVPFADEGTFGTSADVWLSRVPNLRFAIANYQQLPVLTTNFPYSTTGQAVDAEIGLDYLHYFDLYFDYPHARFFVLPNTWFFETFKKDG